MDNLDEFAAFILTNGRPDRVYTYDSLLRSGYTGRIFLVVDDLDKTKDEYIERYGDKVIVFDKIAVSKTFDQADNFQDYRTIVYARNACFDIAEQLNIKYFIELDDDYRHFQYRFDNKFAYNPKVIKSLDSVFLAMLNFFINTKVSSIAMAQGGDFIGGEQSDMAKSVRLKRKCMNSFICSTERRFKFVGRINEDVNTYTNGASKGLVLFTTNQITLEQMQTQSNSGGMTEMYLDSGTYVKSFYSVIFQPSSVTVELLRDRTQRLHHKVAWRYTVPKILSESCKKF